MCAQQQKHTCSHTDTCERHVKHRWELAALKGITKTRRGGGGELRGRGKKHIWKECMQASVSVPCQWWMCLDSPECSSLLSDSSPPTPKPDTRSRRGSKAPLAPYVNKTRSHSDEITFALWQELYYRIFFIIWYVEERSLLGPPPVVIPFVSLMLFWCGVFLHPQWGSVPGGTYYPVTDCIAKITLLECHARWAGQLAR